ncbi:MAG TPA: hypothetical protein VMF64_03825 [Steroidobacteraceae bacterium]|nr:hypothetical protein [Steroidobacteraceae bacterium]
MRALRSSLAAITGFALLTFASSALAQVDLSGNWRPIDSPDQLNQAEGPAPVSYVGIPLNQQGRQMAATADPSAEQEELYRQCVTWQVNYFVEGPFNIQISPVGDPLDSNDVQAWTLSGTPDRQREVIWVNGHPQPPPTALHTYAGFASGHWDGDTLSVHITHLKDNWLLRNDAPESNQATVDMFLNREADLLTMLFIVHDPVYLGAPYPRARTFRLVAGSPTYSIPSANDCMPAEVIEGLSDGYHAARYLPGKNPDLHYMGRYNIAPDVALGATQEIYPAFQKVLDKQYTIPQGYCQADCCAAEGLRGTQCPGSAPAGEGPRAASGPARAGSRQKGGQ